MHHYWCITTDVCMHAVLSSGLSEWVPIQESMLKQLTREMWSNHVGLSKGHRCGRKWTWRSNGTINGENGSQGIRGAIGGVWNKDQPSQVKSPSDALLSYIPYLLSANILQNLFKWGWTKRFTQLPPRAHTSKPLETSELKLREMEKHGSCQIRIGNERRSDTVPETQFHAYCERTHWFLALWTSCG